MPATPPETPGRSTRSTGLFLALAGLICGPVACAANPRQDASPMAAQATLDEATPAPAGAAPPEAAPADAFEELEASLAVYEQQLAYNESRLRAMGVRIAAVGEAEAGDDRYAPPPPARPGDAPYDRRREPSKAKKAEQRPASPDADAASGPPAAPSPRPQPTTRPANAKPSQPGRSAGAEASEAKPVETKTADGEQNRCGELCELADATCDLEAKICDLATRHTAEPRYAEVCRRAGEDCRLASDACTRCSP